MMNNGKEDETLINVLQINLGHRASAHDAITSWLAKQDLMWIICIQEPYFSNKGMTRIPRNYGAFWMDDGSKLKRAAIILPRKIGGYIVTQHSTNDCIVVRVDSMKLSIVSIYCPREKEIQHSMNGVISESLKRKNIICCADTNAHNERWGSIMYKRKWKGKKRGIDLVQHLDENYLLVRNEPPHPPTFVRDSKQYDESHVDVTIVTHDVFNRVVDWQVSMETFSSDHNGIFFKYRYGVQVKEKQGSKPGVPWKKPSRCMNEKMICVLKEVVQKQKFPWVNDINRVDQIMSNHASYVKDILNGVFKRGKERQGDTVYWWSKEVNKVYLEMRKARIRMRRYKYKNLKEEFNEKRREFRRVVRQEKLEAWQKFTSDIADPWEKLIRIVKANTTGKIQARTLSDIDGNFAINLHDTLILLGKQFFPPPDRLNNYHNWVENEVKGALCDVERGPNITMCEFREALKGMSTSTAPGVDEITNNVIRILSQECKLEGNYLKMYNTCLKEGYFPDIWKESKIVLIPKPTTSPNSSKAFRPISLTSTYGKLFERIILARLLHYLTLSSRMSSNQHAYKKGFSTLSALYDVFSVVQKGLMKRGGGVCVAVFLDISGAFDSTWHAGILFKLLEYGVPKYLVLWMKSFLTNRRAFFSEGEERHDVTLEQGCPQGGVLSPILWNVLFNDMLELPIEKGYSRNNVMKVIGYADDAVVICKAGDVHEASGMINRQLGKIHEWSVKHRIRFNSSKLAVMTISNKISRPEPASVYYNGVLINEVEVYKYLGLMVDNKCKWNVHIDSTLAKLALITKSLRGFACGRGGLSIDIFRILFHSIFVPVMMYGITIWGWKAQAKTVVDKFDKEIRRFGLMATRCQKSTPNIWIFNLLKAQSFANLLYMEVLKTSVQQLQVVQSDRQAVYETYCKNRKLREVPQCMDQLFYMYRRNFGTNLCDIEFDDLNEIYCVHPSKWEATKCVIDDAETAMVKGNDKRGWVLYTDASSSSYGVGWSFVAFRHGFCRCIDKGALTRCTIYMAEAYAVLQALRYINTICDLGKREVVEVRSDAQGLVRSLRNPVFSNRILARIKEQLREAVGLGINIVIRWVPGHRSVHGNDYADALAKQAVDSKQVTNMPVTKEDVKYRLRVKQKQIKNSVWEGFSSRNIKKFLPDMIAVNKCLESSPSPALCQVVSGHTRLNEFKHRILGLINTPACRCGAKEETITHFLFECPLHDAVRDEIWEEFQPDFEFVTKNWEKLNKFVLSTGRFDRSRWEKVEEKGEVCDI